LTPLNFR